MSEREKIAQRLQRVRRELDEVSEQVDRLARDLSKPLPEAGGKLKLLGQGEIAAMLDVKPSTIGVWYSRGKMPEPVAQLTCGRIWLESDIKAWIKRRDK